MTNQLETAKEWLADLNKIIDKTDNECTKEKRDVLEWLVESVEELERELEAVDRQDEQWKELIRTAMTWKNIYEEESKRYKQALEFYANEDNWVYGKVQHIVRGEKARKALEESE